MKIVKMVLVVSLALCGCKRSQRSPAAEPPKKAAAKVPAKRAEGSGARTSPAKADPSVKDAINASDAAFTLIVRPSRWKQLRQTVVSVLSQKVLSQLRSQGPANPAIIFVRDAIAGRLPAVAGLDSSKPIVAYLFEGPRVAASSALLASLAKRSTIPSSRVIVPATDAAALASTVHGLVTKFGCKPKAKGTLLGCDSLVLRIDADTAAKQVVIGIRHESRAKFDAAAARPVSDSAALHFVQRSHGFVSAYVRTDRIREIGCRLAANLIFNALAGADPKYVPMMRAVGGREVLASDAFLGTLERDVGDVAMGFQVGTAAFELTAVASLAGTPKSSAGKSFALPSKSPITEVTISPRFAGMLGAHERGSKKQSLPEFARVIQEGGFAAMWHLVLATPLGAMRTLISFLDGRGRRGRQIGVTTAKLPAGELLRWKSPLTQRRPFSLATVTTLTSASGRVVERAGALVVQSVVAAKQPVRYTDVPLLAAPIALAAKLSAGQRCLYEAYGVFSKYVDAARSAGRDKTTLIKIRKTLLADAAYKKALSCAAKASASKVAAADLKAYVDKSFR